MPTGALLEDLESTPPTELAARLESLGYDSVWTGELWGTDAFVRLADVANAVDDVALGTAIVNVFSRSPAVLAGAAAELDDVADGEIRLGIGASTPKAIEDLHGVEYDQPVRRIHETAELVRAFTTGEGRVDYDGELFDVQDFPALDADVPIYTAALGPAARRATGRVADGWLPHNIPFEGLSDAFETIAETAEEAGRDPESITVAPYVPAAVSDGGDEARAAVRGHLAYYVGSGEGYRNAVASVFPDEADAVAEAWRSGNRDDARAAVTDEMVDALGVAGTPETARERLDEIAAIDAIDEPLVVIPSSASDELAERTYEALAPDGG